MIDLHPDEICTTAASLFENAEWRVLSEGLEHRATGYFVARDLIGMRRGDLWEWPLHLAEKAWCRPLPFREAFIAALNAFEITRDAGLAPSFAMGFGLKAGPGSTRATDDFVALGEVIRPTTQTPKAARKRSASMEGRGVGRRSGVPVSQRVAEANVQRASV